MSKGKIINCFFDGSESGFGDFLRGCVHLHDISKYYGFDFDFNMSHHPINKYIYSDCDTPYHKSDIRCLSSITRSHYGDLHFYTNYKKVLHEELFSVKNDEVKYIFSNFHFSCNMKSEFVIDKINKTKIVSDETCSWLQNKLKFSDLIIDEVDKELNSKSIKDFYLLHFRLGDHAAFYNKKQQDNEFAPDFDEIFDICKQTYVKNGMKLPLIIISDSNKLKSYIKKKSKKSKLPFYVFHLKSGHTQTKPSSADEEPILKRSEDNLFYTAFDMRLICIAKSAHSYSVYPWGSGFLTWMAKIYKTPFILTQFKAKPFYNKNKNQSIDNCIRCFNYICSKNT